MRKSPAVVTMAMKNEIISMTKEGHSVREICSELGISTATVYRTRKESGLNYNSRDKGGRVSRTIPLHELVKDTPAKAKEAVEEAVPPVIIADQVITICGTETLTTYRAELKKDTITVDGGLVIGEIEINKIIALAEELKGVYNLVTQMKGNRFGLM